jgi:hypothetical protein
MEYRLKSVSTAPGTETGVIVLATPVGPPAAIAVDGGFKPFSICY